MADSCQAKTSDSRVQQLLLDFLSDHDATCPVCSYNVRALSGSICPECKHELVLTVGVERLRLGWLLIALVPGFFSGVAACFVVVPTIGVLLEDGVLVPPFVGAVLFGWCSGILAVILAFRERIRNCFIAQAFARQRWFAVIIWLVHFAALVAFLIALDPYVS